MPWEAPYWGHGKRRGWGGQDQESRHSRYSSIAPMARPCGGTVVSWGAGGPCLRGWRLWEGGPTFRKQVVWKGPTFRDPPPPPPSHP